MPRDFDGRLRALDRPLCRPIAVWGQLHAAMARKEDRMTLPQRTPLAPAAGEQLAFPICELISNGAGLERMKQAPRCDWAAYVTLKTAQAFALILKQEARVDRHDC